MFETFYGLAHTPFSRDIPTGELYPSIMLEETLGRLEYAARRQLFAVVTGDCGTGKTTAIRRFTEGLDPSEFSLLYLSDSKLTPRNFYKGILEQLGCESKFYRGDAKRQLHREIELMRGIHRVQPIVVVDEAHLLDREMLEEVRFLLNFKMDAQSPMALILVGQSELWDRCIWQFKNAVNGSIFYECKKSQNTQVVHKNLHMLGSLILFLIVLKHHKVNVCSYL